MIGDHLVCALCGGAHDYLSCPLLGMRYPVPATQPLSTGASTAGISLPSGRICPKCNGTDIGLSYCDGVGYDHGRNHDGEKCPSGEHLRVTCRTCRYGWNEPCADAKAGGGRS